LPETWAWSSGSYLPLFRCWHWWLWLPFSWPHNCVPGWGSNWGVGGWCVEMWECWVLFFEFL
jgi:hypothetical protein